MTRELVRSTDRSIRPRVMNSRDQQIARMKQQLSAKELAAFQIKMHLKYNIAS